MHLLYIHQTTDNSVKPIAFTETLEKAQQKLTDIAKEYIVQNEGTKKLETVWQDEKQDLTKLPDGIYFVKLNSSIKVYKKTTEIALSTGYLYNSSVVNTNVTHVITYAISEFENHLLNEFVDTKLISKTQSKKETPTHVSKLVSFDEVIRELSKNGFTAHLKKLDKTLLNKKKYVLNSEHDFKKLVTRKFCEPNCVPETKIQEIPINRSTPYKIPIGDPQVVNRIFEEPSNVPGLLNTQTYDFQSWEQRVYYHNFGPFVPIAPPLDPTLEIPPCDSNFSKKLIKLD
jgi:hypothetical protein